MHNYGFSHVDNLMPSMVDVSEKNCTTREAQASASVRMPSWLSDLFDGTDLKSPKGPVFATAIIAGTMAVKNTANLIPFCHFLSIDGIKLTISVAEPGLIKLWCTVKSNGKTGVEMEALTGVSIASLTIYDMCKSMSKDIEIHNIRLEHKMGGKSDECLRT